MKENPYDGEQFFEKYRRFPRSQQGLAAAGEWPALQKLLPDFRGRRVLDLGCGFGWHCRYAAEQGAARVVGVDLSEKMLAVAKEKTASPVIEYQRAAIEEYGCPPGAFDIVLSSLALHYVEDYGAVCALAYRCLADSGDFVFSVEHPVFTAEGRQDWLYDAEGGKRCWPVDSYFLEGRRTAVFLGEEVVKVHRTLAAYVGGLLCAGFSIRGLTEPEPPAEWVRESPEMADELRRPMMLILAARKE